MLRGETTPKENTTVLGPTSWTSFWKIDNYLPFSSILQVNDFFPPSFASFNIEKYTRQTNPIDYTDFIVDSNGNGADYVTRFNNIHIPRSNPVEVLRPMNEVASVRVAQTVRENYQLAATRQRRSAPPNSLANVPNTVAYWNAAVDRRRLCCAPTMILCHYLNAQGDVPPAQNFPVMTLNDYEATVMVNPAPNPFLVDVSRAIALGCNFGWIAALILYLNAGATLIDVSNTAQGGAVAVDGAPLPNALPQVLLDYFFAMSSPQDWSFGIVLATWRPEREITWSGAQISIPEYSFNDHLISYYSNFDTVAIAPSVQLFYTMAENVSWLKGWTQQYLELSYGVVWPLAGQIAGNIRRAIYNNTCLNRIEAMPVQYSRSIWLPWESIQWFGIDDPSTELLPGAKPSSVWPGALFNKNAMYKSKLIYTAGGQAINYLEQWDPAARPWSSNPNGGQIAYSIWYPLAVSANFRTNKREDMSSHEIQTASNDLHMRVGSFGASFLEECTEPVFLPM